jgi:nucleotide sugar dehydrogenase
MQKRKNGETVCIIGLGYVGLPLACLCAEKGYQTFGLDKDIEKIKKINKKITPFADNKLQKWLKKVNITATINENILKKANIIVICVPTPVDNFYNPNLKPVISAVGSITRNLNKGQLIILESTVNPGVCEEVILPIFHKKKYQIDKDFYLAHCPERINPGDEKWNVRNIPRVVGATSSQGLKKALSFYRSIIENQIRPMKSIKEAEATKIIENSFRDINIAFVNELAKSFEKMNIDLVDVINGAATKPFAFMPHYPGIGVGGHCIPVDPYYLIERAKLSGFNHKFLRLARNINNSMPEYAVKCLQSILKNLKKSIKDIKVGVLGLSYKANVGDMREAPSLKIIQLLKKKRAQIEIYDPYFKNKSTVKNLDVFLKKVKIIILVTNHKEFNKLPKILKKNKIKIIIDGRNCLPMEKIKKMGIIYKGIGR